MPLSEDSRALLQLLLGRGKSYADISGLLGIDEAEVRERAQSALAEVDPSAAPPDADLTDYLLGQADPIARADVSSRIGSDPALADRAASLTDQLKLLVPGANLPDPASAEGGKPRPAKPAPAPAPAAAADATEGSSSKGSGLNSISGHQRRLIALLVGGALLAAVVILLVTGAFGGSDDDGGDGNAPQAAPTVAVLEPVSGEQGSGQIQFGFSGTSLAANMQISGLEPSEKGQGYVLWLTGSTGSFPFYATKVDDSGSITGQLDNINEAVICLIASDFFPTIKVSRADNKEFTQALKQSSLERQNVKLPKFTGETVLEGPISMPQEAKDTIVPVCNGSAQQ